jgi:phosphoglucosamine mutase
MTKRKFFGTDGMRGKANSFPMTGEVAMALGRAVTYYFQGKDPSRTPLIILGKDTRLSCYMLEHAFCTGVCSQGGQVILTGPLPTPAVSFLTSSMRANAGVMISASHNSYMDNGIKLFDSTGKKLPDEVEMNIEELLENQNLIPNKSGSELGRAHKLEGIFGRYIVQVKSCFDTKYDLEGLRVVLDCANGASYKVGPMILNELGAEVIALGINPNGTNINEKCGSQNPASVCEKVQESRADIGLCLDGDADRLVAVDDMGEVVEGDKLIGIMAKYLIDTKVIKKGDCVVGTVMSNIGLEKYIDSLGLKFIRTKVGDRYMIEGMYKHKAILGGEPSGHIILKNYSITGDGLIAAIKIIECCKYYNKNLSQLVKGINLYPQTLKNITVAKRPPLETIDTFQDKVKEIEKSMKGKGRLLVRYSGTEPLVRIMVESESENDANSFAGDLEKVLKKELS